MQVGGWSDLLLAAVVREPMERVLSAFFEVVKRASHRLAAHQLEGLDSVFGPALRLMHNATNAARFRALNNYRTLSQVREPACRSSLASSVRGGLFVVGGNASHQCSCAIRQRWLWLAGSL